MTLGEPARMSKAQPLLGLSVEYARAQGLVPLVEIKPPRNVSALDRRKACEGCRFFSKGDTYDLCMHAQLGCWHNGARRNPYANALYCPKGNW